MIVDVLHHFPVHLTYGVISDDHVKLFVHSSVTDRQKMFNENGNFGVLFYEVINSPFLLWKFYVDVLARIVFNYCDKYILPFLLSGLNDDCRNYTVCTPSTCFGMKKVKVKEIVFDAALKLSKKLSEQSCMSVNSYYITDVFNTYKRGVEINI